MDNAQPTTVFADWKRTLLSVRSCYILSVSSSAVMTKQRYVDFLSLSPACVLGCGREWFSFSFSLSFSFSFSFSLSFSALSFSHTHQEFWKTILVFFFNFKKKHKIALVDLISLTKKQKAKMPKGIHLYTSSHEVLIIVNACLGCVVTTTTTNPGPYIYIVLLLFDHPEWTKQREDERGLPPDEGTLGSSWAQGKASLNTKQSHWFIE